MSTETTAGGIGFPGALCLAFIVLRLCHVIDWAWVWVLSPIWIPFSVLVACCFVLLAATVIAALVKK